MWAQDGGVAGCQGSHDSSEFHLHTAALTAQTHLAITGLRCSEGAAQAGPVPRSQAGCGLGTHSDQLALSCRVTETHSPVVCCVPSWAEGLYLVTASVLD